MPTGNLLLDSLQDMEIQERNAQNLEQKREPTQEELNESRLRLKQYMDSVNVYTSNAKEKLKTSPEKTVDQSTALKKNDNSEVAQSLELSNKAPAVSE